MATQALNQLENTLLTAARMSGAGAYLLDDIVDNVIAAAGARTEVDACKNLAFVDAQVDKTVKGMMNAETLKSFRVVVQGAMRDVACLPSATNNKFADRLNRVAARNIQGYPVEVSDAKAKRVKFKFNLDKFTEREVTIPVTRVSVGQSAVLRQHADDTFTFLRLGDHETRQAVVKKVSAIQDPVGWVEVELGAVGGGTSYGFIAVKGTPVMGQTATVFVDPKTQTAKQLTHWGSRPASNTAAPTKAPSTAAPTRKPSTSLPEKALPAATATATPTAPPTAPPQLGQNISVTIRNANESEAEGGADRGRGGPYDPYALPLLVGEALVDSPTDAPTTAAVEEQQPVQVQCPPAPPPVTCSAATDLKQPGTFFCMTRRTFIIVVCMMVVACALAALGYWIYRKQAVAGGTGSPADSLGDLGFGGAGADLGLGGPPR